MLVQIKPESEGGAPRFVERDALDVTHHMSFEDNANVHAVEWRLAGELVRRDVWVNVLRGLSIGAEAGKVG